MGQRILWNIRESTTLPADLYRQFKQRAASLGFGPTAAIARLMRRFIARGFDDGQPENATTNAVAGSVRTHADDQ